MMTDMESNSSFYLLKFNKNKNIDIKSLIFHSRSTKA